MSSMLHYCNIGKHYWYVQCVYIRHHTNDNVTVQISLVSECVFKRGLDQVNVLPVYFDMYTMEKDNYRWGHDWAWTDAVG